MHIPVLLGIVVEMLNIQRWSRVVDATVGLGGHSQKILQQLGENGVLIALDADDENLKRAQVNLSEDPSVSCSRGDMSAHDNRSFENDKSAQDDRLYGMLRMIGGAQVQFFRNNFENIKEIVKQAGYEEVDAILFDLGMASTHVDEGERGFSFIKDGPLDMRFDTSKGMNAADLVNTLSEEELTKIFRTYGEERFAKKIAREIVSRRRQKRFTRTLKLSELVENILRRGKKHAATKVFQALRIAVNRELEVLEQGLKSAIDILKPGGRIAVISYHSLEDRIVKNIFRQETKDCLCPKEILMCQCGHTARLKRITRKPIVPSKEEIQKNPRSRSAKLRVAEKI